MTSSLPELSRRLETLERENRRLRRFGISALAVAGAAGLMSLAGPAICHTVKGERLLLTDGRGKARIELDTYRSDTPTISVKDRHGHEVYSLSLGMDGDLRFEVDPKDGEAKVWTIEAGKEHSEAKGETGVH